MILCWKFRKVFYIKVRMIYFIGKLLKWESENGFTFFDLDGCW